MARTPQNLQVAPATEVLSKLQSHFQLTRANPFVVSALSKVLSNRIRSASTAAIERRYIDIDYSASFYLQHARAFTPAERNTTRIHFFSCDFSRRHLRTPTDRIVRLLQDKDSYLGFTVIRPGSVPSLGRTFIQPPEQCRGRQAFFPTKINVPASLCGIPLGTIACPYLSQDGFVMACATASLWMSSRVLSTKILGMSEYTTSDITAIAMSLDRPYTPCIGNRGLRIDEIERAFMTMGYDPKIWQLPDPDLLIQSCYTYVESGIPPILTIYVPPQKLKGYNVGGGLHAVTAVGHTFDTSSSSRRNRPIHGGAHLFPSSEFVPSIVLHDDQVGMYLDANIRTMTSLEEQTAAKQLGLIPRAAIEVHYEGETLVSYCTGLIVPFPGRVMLEGNYATLRSASLLLKDIEGRGLIDKNRNKVLRTFLVRSNTYKESLLRRNSHFSRGLKSLYRELPMPRYIWVVEFGYLDEWENKVATEDLKVRGEFIFDSTSADINRACLSIHVPGTVTTRDVTLPVRQPKRSTLPDDTEGYPTFAPHSGRP